MGRAIGIDLGTTNSVAAIKERETKVLQNLEGLLKTGAREDGDYDNNLPSL
jgi:molecular chaperone DnaK (HSP70)